MKKLDRAALIAGLAWLACALLVMAAASRGQGLTTIRIDGVPGQPLRATLTWDASATEPAVTDVMILAGRPTRFSEHQPTAVGSIEVPRSNFYAVVDATPGHTEKFLNMIDNR